MYPEFDNDFRFWLLLRKVVKTILYNKMGISNLGILFPSRRGSHETVMAIEGKIAFLAMNNFGRKAKICEGTPPSPHELLSSAI